MIGRGLPAAGLLAALLGSSPHAAPAPARTERSGIEAAGAGTVTIRERPVAYEVEIRATRLRDERELPDIDMVAASYLRSGAGGPRSQRPVVFFFPGGPGSAASGLNLGGFGPRVIDYPHDPDEPAVATLIDNAHALLDVADLVFVDMPGVGFSRVLRAEDAAAVQGLRQDAQVHARFVRRWLADHDRPDAPIFLAGKSYGTLRASYTGLQLVTEQPRVNLAGMILLSGAWDVSAMDFADSFTPDGDPAAYWSFLPTYAAIAWHYGKVSRATSLEDFVERARRFALEKYAPALLLGERMKVAERRSLSRELAGFTGLAADLIFQHHERISAAVFRRHLVSGRELGFDNATYSAPGDPHEFGGDRALDQAWTRYLAELGVAQPQSYVTGSAAPAVHWDWMTSDTWRMGYPKATQALQPLSKARPALRMFVAAGYFDLATAFFMAESSVAQIGMPQDRIVLEHYLSGHSLWVHPPTRRALSDDVRAFIVECLGAPSPRSRAKARPTAIP